MNPDYDKNMFDMDEYGNLIPKNDNTEKDIVDLQNTIHEIEEANDNE